MIQSLGRRCHAAAAARRHTAYPSAKNTLRLRRNCFFVCGVRCAAAPPASALLRRGGPSGRPAEAWDGEERGGRGQAPPLRVSVGRGGPRNLPPVSPGVPSGRSTYPRRGRTPEARPMGTRCSTRRGSRPKPQKKIAKMVLTGYFEIGYKQGEDLRKLLSLHFPDKHVRVLKDQFGQDRMVVMDDGK